MRGRPEVAGAPDHRSRLATREGPVTVRHNLPAMLAPIAAANRVFRSRLLRAPSALSRRWTHRPDRPKRPPSHLPRHALHRNHFGCSRATPALFPAHSVGVSRSRKGTTTIVSLYSTHLACLFPQHAPGGKHDRSIVLEPWQADILERDPWPFLRGCIRSDGCAFVNRTGPYEYLAHAATRWSEGLRHTLGSASSRLWRNQADAPPSGGGGLTPVEVRILSAASEKPR